MNNYRHSEVFAAAAALVARVCPIPFTGLRDLVLVAAMDESYGNLILPQTAESLRLHQPGEGADLFVGVVVATGRGDRLVTATCQACGTSRRKLLDRMGERRTGHGHGRGLGLCSCGVADWRILGTEYQPMVTKVGDVVLCPRRPSSPGGEFSLSIAGETYTAFFEEQSALAILDDEESLEVAA